MLEGAGKHRRVDRPEYGRVDRYERICDSTTVSLGIVQITTLHHYLPLGSGGCM